MIEKADELVVEASGLTKVFRDFWHRPKVKALTDLDLTVRKGEVFGLLGPNGSGKSTTIKLILGLLHPTGGRLRVLRQSPRDVKMKRKIGYLPEESYLYPYLTGQETLDFYGKLFDLNGRERKQRIDQLLEMIGLKHARNRVVGEFSKGMARRIGLAQALINDPELVILDEPTSGLDPLGTRQVKNLIVDLKKANKTVILSSHLLSDVEDICDRVAILYGGRLRVTGAVHDLLEEQDRYRVTLPELAPDELKRVLEMLREALREEPDVDHPRVSLENLFLDVVEKAQTTGDDSGVTHAENVAEFLGHSGEENKASRLEELVRQESGAEQAPPARQQEETPPEKPAEILDEESRKAAEDKLKNFLPESSDD
jgi:ABC-2 type transport system ATP-binding protein